MSTVDYTRYTRIIHCRPCYNVYLILRLWENWATISPPEKRAGKWLNNSDVHYTIVLIFDTLMHRGYP